MSTLIFPPINSEGLFTFAAPFDSILNPRITYKVMALKNFREISKSGADAYLLYYEPNGLNRLTYDSDMLNNVSIVSLRDDAGVWHYVPSSYILTYPMVSGVPYRNYALVVSLGGIPRDEDLSLLIDTIKDTTRDTVGILPEVKKVSMSAVTLYTDGEDVSARAARTALISSSETCAMLYRDALTSIDHLRSQVTVLEEFISANIGTCLSREACDQSITMAYLDSDPLLPVYDPEYLFMSLDPRPDTSDRKTSHLVVPMPLELPDHDYPTDPEAMYFSGDDDYMAMFAFT